MIAATSDWHLGNGGCADDCCVDGIREVIESALARPVSALCHLGDFGEWWQFGFDEVLLAHKPLLAWLDDQLVTASVPFLLVRGNHDHYPAERLQHGLRLVMPRCDLRVEQDGTDLEGWHLRHGHQWDRWNRDDSWLVPFSRGATWLTGWIERAFPAFDEIAINPKRLVSPARAAREVVRVKIGDRADDWATQNRRWVCYGHTHSPRHWRRGRAAVVNTGSCVNGVGEYATLHEDGRAELFATVAGGRARQVG